MPKIDVIKLPGKSLLVIKQTPDSDFFVLGNNTVAITTFNLSALLKFLLYRGLLSPKVLEGILSEYYDGGTNGYERR